MTSGVASVSSSQDGFQDSCEWDSELLDTRPLLADTARCFAEVRAALLLTERSTQLAVRSEIARQAESAQLRSGGSARDAHIKRAERDREATAEARRDAEALRLEVKQVRLEMSDALADIDKRKRSMDKKMTDMIARHQQETSDMKATITKLERELQEVEYFKQQMADLGQLGDTDADDAGGEAGVVQFDEYQVGPSPERSRSPVVAHTDTLKRRRRRRVAAQDAVPEEPAVPVDSPDFPGPRAQVEKCSVKSPSFMPPEEDVDYQSPSEDQRRTPSRSQSRGSRRDDDAGAFPAKGKAKDGKAKGKSSLRVCIPFIMGSCNLGEACSAVHVSKEDSSKMMEGLRSKPCRDGANCSRKDCMFKHEGRPEPKAIKQEVDQKCAKEEAAQDEQSDRSASHERSPDRSRGGSRSERRNQDDSAGESERGNSQERRCRDGSRGDDGETGRPRVDGRAHDRSCTRSRSRSKLQRRPQSGAARRRSRSPSVIKRAREAGEDRAPLSRMKGKGPAAGKGKDNTSQRTRPWARCTRGDACSSMHVSRGDSSRLLEGLKKKMCRDGAKCIKRDCVFQHPEDRKLVPRSEEEDRRRTDRSPIRRRRATAADAAKQDQRSPSGGRRQDGGGGVDSRSPSRDRQPKDA